MTHSHISRIISIVLLLIATLIQGVPYGFYELLRIIVCGTASYLAYQAIIKDFKAVAWVSAVLAIVFNPVISLHLTKEWWIILNVIAILFFGITFFPKYNDRIIASTSTNPHKK